MKRVIFRWLAAVAALAAAGSGWGYALITAEDGLVMTWEPPIPMRIHLAPYRNLSDGESQESSFIAAMNTWNSSIGSVFSPQVGAGSGYSSGNGISEVAMDSTVAGEDFGDGTLAVTLSYTDGAFRVESDIIFNTAYTWDSYRGNLRANEDIRRVALHELGHVLGLDHPDQNGQSVTAIMNAYVSNLDHLADDDIAGSQSLYGAGDVAPTNDNFANATQITLTSPTIVMSGGNQKATAQSGEPANAGEAARRTVWWKWTAPSNGATTITTADSNFDTVLGVYTGAAVNALAPVASNDDAQSGTRSSAVTFTAVSGTSYFIAVDGWDGIFGKISLHLSFSGVLRAPRVERDFNADGKADLAWTQASSGQVGLWQMDGTAIGSTAVHSPGGNWQVAAIKDFDGDGKADLLWRNSVGGGVVLWQMNGTAVNTSTWLYDGGIAWSPIQTGDFNGDGKTDILWRNSNDGLYSIWLMNGAALLGTTTFSLAADWNLVAVADFNADAKSDILWRSASGGGVVLWTMNGVAVSSSAWIYNSGADWVPDRFGDFNGDGRTDILWRNSTTGQHAVWLMDGPTLTGSAAYTLPAEWRARAVQDFDGDGKADILWRNTTDASVVLWLMSGTSIANSAWLYTGGATWDPIRFGDFNGDGRTDILWDNTTNDSHAIWLMNGIGVAASAAFSVPSGWTPLP